MKIAIITRHNIFNYGSLLQTFALQRFITSKNIKCEVINYVPSEEKILRLANTLFTVGRNGNFLYRVIYYLIQTPNLILQDIFFTKFKKKLILMSKFSISNKVNNDFELIDADILCSGSDQLWGRIGTKEYDANYYFNHYSGKKKLISYASSFGTDNISGKYAKALVSLLTNFKHISVREFSAKNILNSVGISNVEVVLDPVFLLKEFWDDFAADVKYKNYILLYQLHNNKSNISLVKRIAKENNMLIVRITPSLFNLTSDMKNVFLPSPEKFLGFIKNAKYVFTDSFHATAFSIIYNKQFYILPLLNGTYTRIESLLKMFGIDDRDALKFKIDENFIDYSSVNDIMSKKIASSRDVLISYIYH